MNTTSNQINAGDKVTFRTEKAETFTAETNSSSSAVLEYRNRVLSAANAVGVVKSTGFSTAVVCYPKRRVLAIPKKYLLVLPEL